MECFSVSDIRTVSKNGSVTNLSDDGKQRETAKSNSCIDTVTALRTSIDSSGDSKSEVSDDSDSILNPAAVPGLSTSVVADALDGDDANVNTQSSFIELEDLVSAHVPDASFPDAQVKNKKRMHRVLNQIRSDSSSSDELSAYDGSVRRPHKRMKSSAREAKLIGSRNSEHTSDATSSDEEVDVMRHFASSIKMKSTGTRNVLERPIQLQRADDGNFVENCLTTSEHESVHREKIQNNSGLKNGEFKQKVSERQFSERWKQSKQIMREDRGMWK
jgi:hypothetical protein